MSKNIQIGKDNELSVNGETVEGVGQINTNVIRFVAIPLVIVLLIGICLIASTLYK